MEKDLLIVDNVTKKFGKQVAVNAVSFSVKEGEIFGILGPKKSGKSVMLRMICGLTRITDGNILIDNNSIKTNYLKASEIIGTQIGRPKMYKHLSVFDNLRYFCQYYKDVQDKDIINYCKLLGITPFLKKLVSKCPPDVKVKVGIVQAIIHKPKLVIIDDPFLNLDAKEVENMASLIKILSEKEKMTVIISSRLLGEMEKLCNTIGVFNNGNMVELKTMVELLEGSDTSQKLKFTVDYPNFAGKIISNELKFKTNIAGSSIIVYAPKSNMQKISELLKNNNLNIFKIEIITKTLEQVFAEILERKAINKNWIS